MSSQNKHDDRDDQPRLDVEVDVIRQVSLALARLETLDGGQHAIKRVLTWAEDRFTRDPDRPSWLPQVPANRADHLPERTR